MTAIGFARCSLRWATATRFRGNLHRQRDTTTRCCSCYNHRADVTPSHNTTAGRLAPDHFSSESASTSADMTEPADDFAEEAVVPEGRSVVDDRNLAAPTTHGKPSSGRATPHAASKRRPDTGLIQSNSGSVMNTSRTFSSTWALSCSARRVCTCERRRRNAISGPVHSAIPAAPHAARPTHHVVLEHADRVHRAQKAGELSGESVAHRQATTRGSQRRGPATHRRATHRNGISSGMGSMMTPNPNAAPKSMPRMLPSDCLATTPGCSRHHSKQATRECALPTSARQRTSLKRKLSRWRSPMPKMYEQMLKTAKDFANCTEISRKHDSTRTPFIHTR
jgi:hypothetical protein